MSTWQNNNLITLFIICLKYLTSTHSYTNTFFVSPTILEIEICREKTCKFTYMRSMSSFWQVLHDISIIFTGYLHNIQDIHGIYRIFSMVFVSCTFKAKSLAKKQTNLPESLKKNLIQQDLWNSLYTFLPLR